LQVSSPLLALRHNARHPAEKRALENWAVEKLLPENPVFPNLALENRAVEKWVVENQAAE
jgi:hypothetical protein